MDKHKKGEKPYIHLYIYAKIREKFPTNRIVNTADIKKCMRLVIRVPQFMLNPIMHQMEEVKLIERINKQKYKILCESNYIKKLTRLRTSEYW